MSGGDPVEPMEVRHSTHPGDFDALTLGELRKRFVVSELFRPGRIRTVYTHDDRMVVGGVWPEPGVPLDLPAFEPLRSEYFCERRELAVVCTRGSGTVTVDGVRYLLWPRDVLYVGRGSIAVRFETEADIDGPTTFFLVSALSHVMHSTRLVPVGDSLTTEAGAQETANLRVVHKHIHDDGAPSAQLVLGITAPRPGNVWNSMPPHLHDRRTEIYLYFDLPGDERVMHVMGSPGSTRHLVLRDHEAVISPPWSVHFGVGTRDYAFVWAMAGENQSFADMDQVAVTAL